MKIKFDHDRPAILWHFENTQYCIPYCRDVSHWWTGNSLTTDGRGQEITHNARFVTCLKCLKKMKENGIKNPFSKEELDLLKYLMENNHIGLPNDEEKAKMCYRLAASGHICHQLGFKNEVLFYETDTGNFAYNAVTTVYGEE